MHAPSEVLGAMITPAVLISAAALLLLSTTSRLGRINDRLQHLLTEAERLLSSGVNQERKELLSLAKLTSLEDRLWLLRSAVIALYVTIALFVATSIGGGLYVVFPQITSIVPISIGMLGAVSFLYGISLLIREAWIAARVTSDEIAYGRRLLEQQEQRPHRKAG
jgi:hypothetical protein